MTSRPQREHPLPLATLQHWICVDFSPKIHRSSGRMSSTRHRKLHRHRFCLGCAIILTVSGRTVQCFKTLSTNPVFLNHVASIPYVHAPQRPSALAYLPKTDLVSSSLPRSPRFRIAPAFGPSSRGFAASAFRYACCIARALVSCGSSNSVSN
jgi:hypothetical protein